MTEKPMRIAIFIYCLSGGGAQRRTLTLANGFAARGHRVEMVIVSSLESAGAPLAPGIRVHALDRGWRRWFEPLNRRLNVRGLFTLGSTPTLAAFLRRERPDVLLSAASHVNRIAVAARERSRTRTPLVLRASNHPSANIPYWPFVERLTRQYLRLVAGRLYPRAEAIIAVSEGVANDVRALTRVPAERVVTIYNPVVGPEIEIGARAALDHPWFLPGSPPVVLGVGKLKLQKNFPLLVRAFARVRAVRPARLVILGEGGHRDDLERLARRLGVAEDMALPGFVQNPYAWMARSAVFVLSSSWEGLPGALIEAMACGCPVVSTDCPSGPDEILEHGRLAPLVPVGDERALAEAILAVLDRPPDTERLRARAAFFAIDAAVDRYLEVLARVCRPCAH